MNKDKVVDIEIINVEYVFQDIHTETENYFADDVLVHNCKPHKRSEALDFYVPSFLKEKLSVALFADTSGSIADEDISIFKSEGLGILNAFDNVEMTFGYCDAEVQDVFELSNGDDDKLIYSKAKGGGGTDMRKIFKWLKDNDRKPDVVIILTDAFTPFPEPDDISEFKVMWVVTEKGMPENQVSEMQDKGIGEFVKME